MTEEERFQEIKWLLNATIQEFDSFLKSAGEFDEVKVGNGWDPSRVPYFPQLLSSMPLSKISEIAEKKKVEPFRSVFWVIGPKRGNIEMIGEPKLEFTSRWEIEGYHECFFFRKNAYHLRVKDDVVAIEVEGKLRDLVVESSSDSKVVSDARLNEKVGPIMARRPKHFTIDDVVELSYQSRRGHLYLDETGVEDRNFEMLLAEHTPFESLSERTDLDDALKCVLRDAVHNKRMVFDKLRERIVKPPESFSKILSNRLEVTRLNLFIIPLYLFRYRYHDRIAEIRIHGLTGDVLE